MCYKNKIDIRLVSNTSHSMLRFIGKHMTKVTLPPPASQPPKRACRLHAFSLVELLAVVTICALLTGLLVPAVSHIGSANSLAIAGSQVADLANLARQNSLSKNAQTALIVVTNGSQADRNKVLLVYQLVMPIDGQLPQSSDWKPVANAEKLSGGSIIDECTLTSSANQPTPPLPPVIFQGKTMPDYRYTVFLPSGNLLRNAATRIRVAEGYYSSNSSTPIYTGATRNGIPANYREITILPATGKVKVDVP